MSWLDCDTETVAGIKYATKLKCLKFVQGTRMELLDEEILAANGLKGRNTSFTLLQNP